MSFSILMNGVGDAFSTRHYGTHFLLEKDRFLLAVDCPDSYRRALAEHRFLCDGRVVDVEQLDAMLLTHMHGDHVNGLEMTLAYLRFTCHRKLTLYTSREVAEVLWPQRLQVSLGTMWDGTTFHTLTLEDYVDLYVLEWQDATSIGPFEVVSRRTKHHIPTMALTFSDGIHQLGYSCDTAFDFDLVNWLAQADLFLHEANRGPAHTSIDRLNALPKPFRDKMLVVHYSDDLDLAAWPRCQFARQGMTYVCGRGIFALGDAE